MSDGPLLRRCEALVRQLIAPGGLHADMGGYCETCVSQGEYLPWPCATARACLEAIAPEVTAWATKSSKTV